MPYRLAHRPIWWAYFLNWGSLFPERLRLVSVDKKLAGTAYNLGPSQADSYGSECHSAFAESKWQESGQSGHLTLNFQGVYLAPFCLHTIQIPTARHSVMPQFFCLWVCNQITIATATGLGKLLFRGRSYGCECCTLIWHGLNWDGCSSPTLDFEKWQRKF